MINNKLFFPITLAVLMTFLNVSTLSASVSSKNELLPAPKWSGFYAGLNAGGIWSASSTSSILSSFVPNSQSSLYPNGATYTGIQSASGATGNISISNGGFIGGGQIGYNWQLTDRLIGGLETDFQGIASEHNDGGSSNTVPLIGTYDGGTYRFLPGEFYM